MGGSMPDHPGEISTTGFSRYISPMRPAARSSSEKTIRPRSSRASSFPVCGSLMTKFVNVISPGPVIWTSCTSIFESGRFFSNVQRATGARLRERRNRPPHAARRRKMKSAARGRRMRLENWSGLFKMASAGARQHYFLRLRATSSKSSTMPSSTRRSTIFHLFSER